MAMVMWVLVEAMNERNEEEEEEEEGGSGIYYSCYGRHCFVVIIICYRYGTCHFWFRLQKQIKKEEEEEDEEEERRRRRRRRRRNLLLLAN